MVRIRLPLALALVCALPDAPGVLAGEGARRRAHATRAGGPIEIDARLDEPDWARAVPIVDLRTPEPVRGAPLPQRTEIRVLYDAGALYLGLRAFDTDPGAIVASIWILRTSTNGASDHQAAFGARLTYPNDRWFWDLSAVEIQENFDPALGFANRTDIREYSGQLRHRWRPGACASTRAAPRPWPSSSGPSATDSRRGRNLPVQVARM